MSVADRRMDELRARRAARAEERAQFEKCRQYGLNARHAAKLAWLATRAAAAQTESTQAKEENPTDPDNSISPEPSHEPEVA